MTPGQLSVLARRPHREKRGKVALQSATDGRWSLVPLALTHNRRKTCQSPPICFLWQSALSRTHRKKNTHSETCEGTCTHSSRRHPPAVHPMHVTHAVSSRGMMTGSTVPKSEWHCKHTDGKTEGGKTPDNYC